MEAKKELKEETRLMKTELNAELNQRRYTEMEAQAVSQVRLEIEKAVRGAAAKLPFPTEVVEVTGSSAGQLVVGYTVIMVDTRTPEEAKQAWEEEKPKEKEAKKK